MNSKNFVSDKESYFSPSYAKASFMNRSLAQIDADAKEDRDGRTGQLNPVFDKDEDMHDSDKHNDDGDMNGHDGDMHDSDSDDDEGDSFVNMLFDLLDIDLDSAFTSAVASTSIVATSIALALQWAAKILNLYNSSSSPICPVWPKNTTSL